MHSSGALADKFRTSYSHQISFQSMLPTSSHLICPLVVLTPFPPRNIASGGQSKYTSSAYFILQNYAGGRNAENKTAPTHPKTTIARTPPSQNRIRSTHNPCTSSSTLLATYQYNAGNAVITLVAICTCIVVKRRKDMAAMARMCGVSGLDRNVW